MALSRAAGLLLGFAADRVLGDPARWHPVAGFGVVAARFEERVYAPTRPRGAAYVVVLVGGTAAAGVLVERAVRRRPVLQGFVTAVATWAVLGGRSLEREAEAVATLLQDGDLPAARERLTHLVGRDPSQLDESGVSRAVVESIAENTADAVVAPLVLGAVAGVPGLLGYRAANTLDAMVGHRSKRYAEFGWAAARLDDLLNLPGSRLTALLAVVLGPAPCAALGAWARDAAAHPSPNAGPVEAAFAGALGLRLGGTNVYGTGAAARTEHRAVLGDGRAPATSDVRRATALARRVDMAAVLIAAALAGRPGRDQGRARRTGGFAVGERGSVLDVSPSWSSVAE